MYPLDFPSNIFPKEVQYEIRRIQAYSESPFTGHRQYFDWGSEWLFLNMSFPPFLFNKDSRKAQDLISFLTRLKGFNGTFYFGVPNPDERYSGSYQSAATVLEVLGRNKLKLATTSYDPGTFLKAGNWINLANGEFKKVEAIDESGTDTVIEFSPVCQQTPALYSSIEYIAPRGVFRLQEPNTKWSIDKLRHYGVSISAREIERG